MVIFRFSHPNVEYTRVDTISLKSSPKSSNFMDSADHSLNFNSLSPGMRIWRSQSESCLASFRARDPNKTTRDPTGSNSFAFSFIASINRVLLICSIIFVLWVRDSGAPPRPSPEWEGERAPSAFRALSLLEIRPLVSLAYRICEALFFLVFIFMTL